MSLSYITLLYDVPGLVQEAVYALKLFQVRGNMLLGNFVHFIAMDLRSNENGVS
jgi:hypothetical protein